MPFQKFLRVLRALPVLRTLRNVFALTLSYGVYGIGFLLFAALALLGIFWLTLEVIYNPSPMLLAVICVMAGALVFILRMPVVAEKLNWIWSKVYRD